MINVKLIKDTEEFLNDVARLIAPFVDTSDDPFK